MIRDLNDDDKPREKALQKGIQVLSDAELLAILLRVGVKGRNVIEVSRDVLAKFNNDLGQLAKASPQQLQQLVPGIGASKAVTVIAALELGARCRSAAVREKTLLKGSEAVYNYMLERLENCDHEEFWIVMLNRRLAIEGSERISVGGMDSTVVDVRLLVKKALDARASAIILVHNHPSGNLQPSTQDDTLTQRIKDACALLDIKVLDHVIIGVGGYYSYADNSRL